MKRGEKKTICVLLAVEKINGSGISFVVFSGYTRMIGLIDIAKKGKQRGIEWCL